jgi:hypothetical protein
LTRGTACTFVGKGLGDREGGNENDHECDHRVGNNFRISV